MKKLLLVLLGGLIFLLAIVLIRTLSFTSENNYTPLNHVSVPTTGEKLSRAIQFETISHKKEMRDDSTFADFHSFLSKAFPNIFSQLRVERIERHSLLISWPGKNPDRQPLILAAHMDVVPVDYSSSADWDYPPFSGAMKDGFIYGRGTIDDKGSMLAILEAVEGLLAQGVQPKRPLVLAFGHDEEIGGEEGAAHIAKLLKSRGTNAWMVLDEGGTLATGLVPGIDKTVALIGTSEKGYVSLEIISELPGGHSSMPEPTNALEKLNKAISILKDNPLPDRFTEPLKGFIGHIGPELPFVQKMAFANVWLFRPLIFSTYRQSASGAALIHTTQVVTMFNSGIKDNVVPTRARAVVNYRLLPGDEPEEILMRARNLIGDSALSVRILDGFGESASPVSSHTSEEFAFLAGAIKAVNPDVLISPYLVLGATDGRYYSEISSNVFRFSPIPLAKGDLARIHGVNERVGLEAYQRSIDFYCSLIGNL